MNYQAIRATFEAPLIAAYNGLNPSIPVYCDNVINYDGDAVDEFVHVNFQFGLTTEQALTTNHKYVRGIIVVRIHTQKGQGPGRNQALAATAYNVLDTLNNTAKTSSGVYVRMGSIDGPTFSPTFAGTVPDQQSRRAFTPYFISRIKAGFQATIIP